MTPLAENDEWTRTHHKPMRPLETDLTRLAISPRLW